MHPLAHTLSHGFALENGGDQGTIIKTHDAYVFCGFRQDDGGIQFKTMMQYEGNTHEMLESQGLMKTSEPVFMTEDEMQKTGSFQTKSQNTAHYTVRKKILSLMAMHRSPIMRGMASQLLAAHALKIIRDTALPAMKLLQMLLQICL